MANATEELRELDRSIERGLDFVYRFGNEGKSFANYGSFLICCFALVAATSRNSKLRRLAPNPPKKTLRAWSSIPPFFPSHATSDLLLEFVLVRYAQRRIRVRHSLGA